MSAFSLHQAAEKGDLASVRSIANPANVNTRDNKGRTALHYAASSSSEHAAEVVKTLIDNGAKLDVQDKDGKTPLHRAAPCSSLHATEVVKTLVENGAKVNLADSEEGWTPLHLAVKLPDIHRYPRVKALIAGHARINVKDKKGRLPLEFAEVTGADQELIGLLSPPAFELADQDFFWGSRKLGSGAYGSVYSGELRDGTDVAVKRIRYECHDVEDLQKEVDALVALASCQRIAVLYGYHVDDAGQMFLVMERLEHTLWSVIESGNKRNQLPCVELPNFYAWLLGAAKGLKHMHDRGYVHRDIKPENVMVDGNNNKAKLVDMGSAMEVDTVGHSQISSGTASGTYRLALSRSTVGAGLSTAPEMTGSSSSTASDAYVVETFSELSAADVYALGRTGGVMITGNPDYEHLPDGVQLPLAIRVLIESMTQEDVHQRPVIGAVISTLKTYAAPSTQQGSQSFHSGNTYDVNQSALSSGCSQQSWRPGGIQALQAASRSDKPTES